MKPPKKTKPSKSKKDNSDDSLDEKKTKKSEKNKELNKTENKNYYKMTTNEFLFIYNLCVFEKLNRRPTNEIKIYYFIKKKWIELFKDFFNCKKIYKIIDKNIMNYMFMNQINAEMIPDEIKKIKTKDETIPKELMEFNQNEEYLVKLNNGNESISYYPFKLCVIEESMKNSLVIGKKICNFEKGMSGVMCRDTLYLIIDERTLEIFIFDDSDNTFDPFCLFCYQHKNDLYNDLIKKYKYKEIKECLKELDFMQKKMPKCIRDDKKNVIGSVIYLLGDDPSENINNYLEEINNVKNRREKEMKEFDEEIIIKREKEEKRIIT